MPAYLSKEVADKRAEETSQTLEPQSLFTGKKETLFSEMVNFGSRAVDTHYTLIHLFVLSL